MSRVSQYVDTTREVSVKLAMNVISIIQKRIVKDTWLETSAVWHVQKDIDKSVNSGKVVKDASGKVNANIFTKIQDTRKVEPAKLEKKGVT